MWAKFKNCLKTSYGFYTGLFIFIWLTAWTYNALYGAKFDLKELQDIFVWLSVQLNIKHAVDSALNSPKGASPN